MSVDELKEAIEKLQHLREQLKRVRDVPPLLMKGIKEKGTNFKGGDEFGPVKEMGEEVEKEEVQRALGRAAASGSADSSDIWPESRREKRRKRSPEREASTPLAPPGSASTSVVAEEATVTMAGLGDWARAYNEGHETKVRIREKTVRMAIADVMTVYMSIGTGADGESAVVETIRAFGPREGGGGLAVGQSKYAVFQQLSQQLMAIAEATPGIAAVSAAVAGYSSVFVARCSGCGRVVGGDGHVPAVVRRGGSAWHVGCVIGGALGQ